MVNIIGNTTYISVSELGVFQSTNHGKTWKSVNDGLPQSHSWELYAVGNTQFAVDREAGIFQLTNGQNTWAFVNSHPPSEPSTVVNAIEVVDNTLYVATGGWGVYRIGLEKSASD